MSELTKSIIVFVAIITSESFKSLLQCCMLGIDFVDLFCLVFR